MLRAAVLLLAVGLGACSTAREREEPKNIFGTLRFRNTAARDHFQASLRSGNLYHDFRPVLIVDAIFQDQQYRRIFLETLKERYLLEDADFERMMAEDGKRFDSFFEFVVLVYGGSNEPVRINRPQSNWKIYLRDDDGDLIRPASIRPIASDSPTYLYLKRHFTGLDRWSEPFIVRFPKLPKVLLGQTLGPHPFELIVSGVEGTVTMRWDDPALFYRRREAEAAPERAEPASPTARSPEKP